jgi:hypothetical protein
MSPPLLARPNEKFYPDIIKTNATLPAANAPKEILARIDGKIVKLFVKNDEDVSRDATIAWLESTASHKEVIALNHLLDSGISLLEKNKIREVSDLFLIPFENLGELQASYRQFVVARPAVR